jgi:hypothetical protein
MDRAAVEAKLAEVKAQYAQQVRNLDATSGAMQVLEQLLKTPDGPAVPMPGAIVTSTDT